MHHLTEYGTFLLRYSGPESPLGLLFFLLAFVFFVAASCIDALFEKPLKYKALIIFLKIVLYIFTFICVALSLYADSEAR